MRELPSGTVTFLFTDVEGSTRLLHELGANGYASALADHRRVIREACAANGGVEVDTQGDAFFFAFPTAPGALDAAIRFTDALASGPIQVRVGLHTGTPLVTSEGYVGDDVHFAARVAASAHGGQVILSAATAELVEEPLTELGEHRLKDIAEAVSILQLGASSFPPLKTISNTNLPRPASSFVGREAELAEVLDRIDRGARLVTLTGPGGSGKTRLAIEAASTLVPEYKAGVFWVGLASLRDPALVTETISQTLGAKDGLAEHVGERELLLLLDNLEQVIEAALELSALLSECPNLTLLVTSRELVRVQGEVEYPVPPLAEPEAVELFCERAQLERSGNIAELCARLDNLPLAVELAAARTKALSVAQILERLSQRLDLLKGGRDADPRQQTLRATIEWSYDLLAESEQQLFRRLSVFAGGCTLEAAEQVADADIDTLQSLVEKSLLRFTDERYWMLETIHELAAERLAHSSEQGRRVEHHSDYFVALVAEADAVFLTGRDQELWLDRLQADYANIRASLEYVQQRDSARLLECSTALWWFWRVRGYFAEARLWLERGLATDDARPTVRARALGGAAKIARAQGDLEGAWEYAQGELRIGRASGDERAVSRALLELATIAADRLEFDRALVLQREAIGIVRGFEDKRPLALNMGNLGYITLAGGDAEQAIVLLEESLALHDAGDVMAQSIVLLNLGAAQLSAGHLDASRRSFVDALGMTARLGSEEFLAYALQGVAATTADIDPWRAAELLGASGRLLDEARANPEPLERQVRETALERVAEALGDAAAGAVLAGAVLETTDAVDRALSIEPR